MAGQPFRDRLARFNRVVTNPVMGTWAPYVAPWAVLEHHGRRSGRAYRTPVWAFVDGPDLVVLLTYGRDRDWVRNIEAAGGCTVERAGQRFPVTDPRVVHVEDVLAAVPSVLHPAIRALDARWALRLRRS